MKFYTAPVDLEIKSIMRFKHVFNLYKETFKVNDEFRDIMGLTENELFVLDVRFENNGAVAMSRPRIGKLIDVCSERVRQIELKALGKIKIPTGTEKVEKLLKEEAWSV